MMVTTAFFKQMRLVGGDVALDFVNTQAGPPGGPPTSDALGSYADLLHWSLLVGTVGDEQAARLAVGARARLDMAAHALARAVDLRAHLGEIFHAVAAGAVPGPASLEALRDDWASALRHAHLVDGGEHFGWDWSDSGDLTVLLWPVVRAALELLTTPAGSRVRQCSGCSFVFLDGSKNGSRRWCSMEDCGKAQKMRTYVARRRASRIAARAIP